jgi:acyl-CoA synthetase (NDP forming)
MRQKLSKGFFLSDEVLFIGYSRTHAGFSKNVYEAFKKTGAEVYPVNPHGGSGAPVVYASLEEVPARPIFAYVLTGKATTAGIVDSLVARGVKRVLFNSTSSVDRATLERCESLGLETAVACPLMALGGGFHKFHGLLSGVRQ